MLIDMVEAAMALATIEKCSRHGGRVLGIDGFQLHPRGYIARLDLTWDLSIGVLSPIDDGAKAIQFVRKNAGDDIRFEVITDERPSIR